MCLRWRRGIRILERNAKMLSSLYTRWGSSQIGLFLELSYALNIFEPLNVKNKTKCYNFANSISMVKNPHLTWFHPIGPCPNNAWLIPADDLTEVFCECQPGYHFSPSQYACRRSPVIKPLGSNPGLHLLLKNHKLLTHTSGSSGGYDQVHTYHH